MHHQPTRRNQPHHREELSAADGQTRSTVRVPVCTEGLFGAPATRIVTNRAAGASPRISSAKCVFGEQDGQALAQSDPVWLVQRVVAEKVAVLTSRDQRSWST